jgi:hypothetical protein
MNSHYAELLPGNDQWKQIQMTQCGVICSVGISNGVIIICSYDLQVVNTSIHQSKPRL